MKTAILYYRKKGMIEHLSRFLEKEIKSETDIYSYRELKNADTARYDLIIIGYSFYSLFFPADALRRYLYSNLWILNTKNVALFLCGSPVEKSMKKLEEIIPEELMKKAVITGEICSIYNYKNMLLPERIFALTVNIFKNDFERIDYKKLYDFVEELKK